MLREIRARFRDGKLEPLEESGLKEGEEVLLTISDPISDDADAALAETAGAWEGTLDFDAYLRDLHRLRRDPGRRISL